MVELYYPIKEVANMALIDYILADIKQLESKMAKAETVEEFKILHKDLKEKLELYDKERGKS